MTITLFDELLEIRDNRLYRENFGTFEEYCRERWGMSKIHAYRLMSSSEVMNNLESNQLVTPQTESQARPLSSLPPEKQKEAWEKVVETAPGGKGKLRRDQGVNTVDTLGIKGEQIVHPPGG